MVNTTGFSKLFLAGVAVCAFIDLPSAFADYTTIRIVIPKMDDGAVRRVAEVIAKRITARSAVDVSVADESTALGLQIYLGYRGAAPELERLCAEYDAELPGRGGKEFSEGFAVKAPWPYNSGILALGADRRGMLYAAGEILRHLTYNKDSVAMSGGDVSTSPAYSWRGFSANQGGTMQRNAGTRSWTQEELQDYLIDIALAGGNTFYCGGATFDFLKSFDLLTTTNADARPNQFYRDYPPEWQSPTERGNYLCPSIPEARAALMKQWREVYTARQPFDVVRFFAGDPGGCRCDKCAPWGKTFIELCEEMAAIILEVNPNTHIQIANQDIDNAGDKYIFKYLNEKPRDWLDAISYGPGSNPMSDYFRPELREDLFEYPRSGSVNRFLAELLHRLPDGQTIVHYSDITHWISAQYEVARPDPSIIKVFGRRTFHARPGAMYDIFQAIMPFSDGDIIYSEGYHDEFHQYLWNRLLWDPNRKLLQVMWEYCRYYFGSPDAMQPMTEALLALEQTLEQTGSTNYPNYYDVVKRAGARIPANLMARDHRWRMHMQTAALQRYVEYKVRNDGEAEQKMMETMRRGLRGDAYRDELSEALRLAHEPRETDEMNALREEARTLGEETDRLFGVRNDGYFALDQELTNLGWLTKELEKAVAETDDQTSEAITRAAIFYGVPESGEFYDDAGNPSHQPHLVSGESSSGGFARLDPGNRLSQNTYVYTTSDVPIVFRYEDLDPAASYRVRMALAASRQAPRVQHVLADGEYLARDLEVPTFTAQIISFDVPAAVTADGTLELSIVKSASSPSAILNDLWLEKLPGLQ